MNLTDKLEGIKIRHDFTWSPDAEAQARGDKRPASVVLDFSNLTLEQVIAHAVRHITYRQLQTKLKAGKELGETHIVLATGERRAMTEGQRDDKLLSKKSPESLERLLIRVEEAVARSKAREAEAKKAKK